MAKEKYAYCGSYYYFDSLKDTIKSLEEDLLPPAEHLDISGFSNSEKMEYYKWLLTA